MLITRSKFEYYRQSFHNKVKASPVLVNLVITTATPAAPVEGFSFEDFVGSSSRTTISKPFNALYEKEIPNRTRDKYGLSREVNGVVYLSPLQLVSEYGTHILNWNTTKVQFNGRTQVINKIIYLEEMYDSCVGVQIFVQDDVRGG